MSHPPLPKFVHTQMLDVSPMSTAKRDLRAGRQTADNRCTCRSFFEQSDHSARQRQPNVNSDNYRIGWRYGEQLDL